MHLNYSIRFRLPVSIGTGQLNHHQLTAPAVSLLFDVVADLPEGITVMPVFAADKAEALKAAKELFPGHRVTVVLKEGEPGT